MAFMGQHHTFGLSACSTCIHDSTYIIFFRRARLTRINFSLKNPIPMLTQHIYAIKTLLVHFKYKFYKRDYKTDLDFFPCRFYRVNCKHRTIYVPTTFKKSFQEYTFIPISSASLICSLVAKVNATNAIFIFG